MCERLTDPATTTLLSLFCRNGRGGWGVRASPELRVAPWQGIISW
jgi:hypothetical protein